MGFGLSNAPTTFSRLMNHVLEPFINKFVIVYLDDICIYSETPEQHIEHLRLVLQKLREHQLFIKMPKCFWGRKETEYLGVIVGNGTLRTAPDKISSVRDWPLPETQKQIKSFAVTSSSIPELVDQLLSARTHVSAIYLRAAVKHNPQQVVAEFDALLAELAQSRRTGHAHNAA